MIFLYFFYVKKTINLKNKSYPRANREPGPRKPQILTDTLPLGRLLATRVGLGLHCPKAQFEKILGPTHCNIYDFRPAFSFLFPMWDINSLGP
jgi:hypothetical protein